MWTGAGSRNRTDDLLITSELHHHSAIPAFGPCVAVIYAAAALKGCFSVVDSSELSEW